jgi:hypothetical protein
MPRRWTMGHGIAVFELACAVVLRIRVDEDEQVINYTRAAKYLSTNLHVALARILRARRTGHRLAWLWCDQGVWLSRLRDGEVDRLNIALGRASAEG